MTLSSAEPLAAAAAVLLAVGGLSLPGEAEVLAGEAGPLPGWAAPAAVEAASLTIPAVVLPGEVAGGAASAAAGEPPLAGEAAAPTVCELPFGA